MAIASPTELSTNPFKRISADIRTERAADKSKLPPGPKSPSLARTELMRRDPLAVLFIPPATVSKIGAGKLLLPPQVGLLVGLLPVPVKFQQPPRIDPYSSVAALA